MRLVDKASNLVKMPSVQVASLTAALGIAGQFLSQLQEVIHPAAFAVLFAMVIIARVIKQ